jgi:hypothetical protein
MISVSYTHYLHRDIRDRLNLLPPLFVGREEPWRSYNVETVLYLSAAFQFWSVFLDGAATSIAVASLH